MLDLGNCGLTAIPARIGDLVWVESITFADQWNTWHGDGWRRNTGRNISHNNGGTSRIRGSLAPLDRLTNLKALFLTGRSSMICLCLPGALAGLRALDISSTRVRSVEWTAGLEQLAGLADLPALETLRLDGGAADVRLLPGQPSNTSVADLTPVRSLIGQR